jgi:hypothetical protein
VRRETDHRGGVMPAARSAVMPEIKEINH